MKSHEKQVIVISRPIAAGKSTLAHDLAARCVKSGSPAVAVELDLIADIIRRSDPLPNPSAVWQRPEAKSIYRLGPP